MRKKIIAWYLVLILYVLSTCSCIVKEESWTCEKCGKTVSGFFCSQCGAAKPSSENDASSSSAALDISGQNSSSTINNSKTESSNTLSKPVSGNTAWAMSTEGTIDPTVLYDSDGLIITATEIQYSNSAVNVVLEIENNSNKDLSITSATMGYSCNAVNRYMVSDGYVNVDVASGKKANKTASFSINDLLLLGIREISTIEMSFTISDKDYNSIHTEPAIIETTLTSTHDDLEEGFYNVINSSFVTQKYDLTVVYCSDEQQVINDGVTVISTVLANNKKGECQLILELENTADEIYAVKAKDIEINGLTICSGVWKTATIIGNHKALLAIPISNVFDPEYYELFGITNFEMICLVLAVVDSENNTLVETPFSVALGNNPTFDKNGMELYNGHGIRIIYVGALQEVESYSKNIHFFMIIENNGKEDMYVDDEFDSFSINDYMTDCYCYSTFIRAGKANMWEIEFPEYNFKDVNISRLEEILSAEITLLIRDHNFLKIDESKISIIFE